jgi:hypothetical protein
MHPSTNALFGDEQSHGIRPDLGALVLVVGYRLQVFQSFRVLQ